MWGRRAGALAATAFALGVVGISAGAPGLVVAGLVLAAYLLVTWTLTLSPGGYGSGAERSGERASARVLRRFSVTREFEGLPIQVELALSHNPFGRGAVHLADRLDPTLEVTAGASRRRIGHGDGLRLAYAFTSPLFGPYLIGPLRVRQGDAAGLFFHEVRVGHRDEVTFMPRLLPFEEMLARTRRPKLFSGRYQLRLPGPGTEFYALREYLPGDPLRAINWKGSARHARLMVNSYEREAITTVYLVLDARAVTGTGRVANDSLHRGARAAATLARHLLEQRNNVGLVVYDRTIRWIPASGGDRHYFDILLSLSNLAPRGDLPLAAVLRTVAPIMVPRSPVVVLSPLEGDASAVPALRDLVAQDFPVTLLSPAPESEDRLVDRFLDLARSLRMAEMRRMGIGVRDWPANEAFPPQLEMP